MLANYMGFYCLLFVDVENHVVFSVAGGTEVHSLQDSKDKAVLLASPHCVMSLSGSSCHPSACVSVCPGPKVLPHPSVTWPLYLSQAISRTNIFVFQLKGIPIITGTQESQWYGSMKFQPKTTGHTFTVLSSQYVAVEDALRNRLTFWSEAQHTLTHHLWHWYPRSAWSERIQTFFLGSISYMIHYVFFF